MTNSDIVALLMPLAATGAVLLTGVAVVFQATHRKSGRKRRSVDHDSATNAATGAGSTAEPQLFNLLTERMVELAAVVNAPPGTGRVGRSLSDEVVRRVLREPPGGSPNDLLWPSFFNESKKVPAAEAAREYQYSRVGSFELALLAELELLKALQPEKELPSDFKFEFDTLKDRIARLATALTRPTGPASPSEAAEPRKKS